MLSQDLREKSLKKKYREGSLMTKISIEQRENIFKQINKGKNDKGGTYG